MISRRRKVILALLALLIFSQAPFAYRLYQLGRLRADVARLNAERLPPPPGDPFEEYAGVIHVHSSLGGHSDGTPEEIVRAAKENGLAFVVMTEHPSAHVNTADATLKGTHEGVVFVNGGEAVAAGGERFFVVPGFSPDAPEAIPAQQLVDRARAEGRLSVVAYPGQVRAWDFAGYDGIEVYNLYTNTKLINYPRLILDGLWSYWSYPDLLFATFYERPDAALRTWDELNAAGGARLAAYGGNDAHANVGFSLGSGGGRKLGVKLDPYERSFQVVRNHVLLERGAEPTAETITAALRAGRSFIAFPLFGDPRGFRFTAGEGRGRKSMGDEVELAGGGPVPLSARAPVECRIAFYRDGRLIHEARGVREASLRAEERGVYRVEVYLDRLGRLLEGKPWIISNPIYVR